MKTPAEILNEAQSVKPKETLGPYRETILTLREKNYSWRDIAEFLVERGIETDHSKLFRFINKPRRPKMDVQPKFEVPTAEQYGQALKAIKISPMQRKMLESHFRAHNRTATYTELAKAAGYDSYSVANSNYGKLGAALGKALDMTFLPSATTPDSDFYSSAIGRAIKHGDEEWILIMHHELAKALDSAEWFGKTSA